MSSTASAVAVAEEPAASAIAVEEPPIFAPEAKPSFGLAEPVTPSDGALATEAAAGPSLDPIREAACSALDREGHNTAAELLHNSLWNLQGNSIEVQVPKKKTMLALMLNADVEAIVRKAIKAIGANHKIAFVPSENAVASAAAPRSAPSAAAGGVQAAALDNPLVKKTQELFKAEIRSVLDLRES